MVRETRHLWVGNLPDNITEDRIKEHFKRYGRVQSVKLLAGDGAGGPAATVAFIDIKSAAKAHNADNRVEDRPLITSYHDPNGRPPGEEAAGRGHPAGVGPGPGPGPYPAGRGRAAGFSRGCADDMSVRSSQVYGDAFGVRRYDDYKPGRRNFRNGPFLDRGQGSRYRPGWYGGDLGRFGPADVYPGDRSPGVGKALARRGSPATLQHARITINNNKAAQPKRSGSGSGSESRSHSRSSSRSRSSASSRSSSSTSRTSRSRSGSRSKSRSPARRNKRGGLSSAVAAVAASTQQSGSVSSGIGSSSPQPNGNDEHRRPIAICVKNLPARSSDTSLKDGLFHEYKKHGKVTTVKIIGQGAERYAIVCFKKPEDAEKALNVSHDKSFFGSKIEVALYDGFEVDDSDHRLFSRQYETELDEYHPKATRTLFIGNLDKDVKQAELRKAFEKFGEIIEVDIKKQQSSAPYAFLQFCDIESVVKAMRAMDGEHLGGSAAKLGFGRSMSNSCVWVDGVADAITDKYLARQFSKFGNVVSCDINRARGSALVAFETASPAQVAVIEMRGRALGGKRLQIDFASRECQEAFFEQLNKQQPKWEREHPTYRFGQQRYDRGSRSYRGARFVRRGGRTFEYDDFSRDPPAGYDESYEQELRDYYSQRHGDPEYRRVLDSGAPPYSPARRRSADRSPSASRTERRAQLQSVVTVGRPLRGGADDELPMARGSHSGAPPGGSSDESGERPAKRPRTAESLSDDARPGGGCKRVVTAPDSDGSAGCSGKPIEVHVTSRRGSDAKRPDSRRVSVDSVKTDEAGEERVTQEIPLEPVSKRRRRSEGGDPRTARPSAGSSGAAVDDDGQRTPLYDEVDEPAALEPRGLPAAARLQPMVLPLPKFAQLFMTAAQAQALTVSSPLAAATVATAAASATGAGAPSAAAVSAAPRASAAAVALTSPPALMSPPRRSSVEKRPDPSTKASAGAAGGGQQSPRGSDSSDHSPLLSPSLEDQIRALDVKYEKWSGSSRTIGCTVPSDRLKLSSRLLSLDRIRSQPSPIMQKLLAKQSVFDEDSKRLENFGKKYEPKPMDPAVASELRTKTVVSGTAAIAGTFSGLISKVCRPAMAASLAATVPSATLVSAPVPAPVPTASPAPALTARPPPESPSPAAVPTTPADAAAPPARPQPQPPPPLTMPVDVSPAGAARTAPLARIPTSKPSPCPYSPTTPVSATPPSLVPASTTLTTTSQAITSPAVQTSAAVTPVRRPEPGRLGQRPPSASATAAASAEPGSPCWEPELAAQHTEGAGGGVLEPEVPASLPTPPCSITDRASVDSVSDCTVSSSTEIGADADKKLAECASPRPPAEEDSRPEEPPATDGDHAGTVAEPLISSSSSLSHGKEAPPAPAPEKPAAEDADDEKEPALKDRLLSDEQLLKSVMKPAPPLPGLHGVTERVMTLQREHVLDERVSNKLASERVSAPPEAPADLPVAPARTAKVKREHSTSERPRSDSVSSRGDKREKSSSSHRNSEHHRRSDKSSSDRPSKEQRSKDRRAAKEASKETPATAVASRDSAAAASAAAAASKRRLSSLEESDGSVDSKHSKHRHDRRDDSSSAPPKKPKLSSVSSTISSSSVEHDAAAPAKPEKPPREKASGASSASSHRQHDDEKAEREPKRPHDPARREDKHDKKRDDSKYKLTKKENHSPPSEDKREEASSKGAERVEASVHRADPKKDATDRSKHRSDRSTEKDRARSKSSSHDKKRDKHAPSKDRVEKEREAGAEKTSKEVKRTDKTTPSVRKPSKLVYNSEGDSDVEEKTMRKPKEKEPEKSHSTVPCKEKSRSKDQEKRREKKAADGSSSRSSDHQEKSRELPKLEIKIEPGLELREERPNRPEPEKAPASSHDKKSPHPSHTSHQSHSAHSSHSSNSPHPHLPAPKDKSKPRKKSSAQFGGNSDSDSNDDEPPKKNIFDVVIDDEPPFFSMYDKVKRQRACQIKKAEEPKTPVSGEHPAPPSKKSSRSRSSSSRAKEKKTSVMSSGSDESDIEMDRVFSKKKPFDTSSEDEDVPRKPALVKEETACRPDEPLPMATSSKPSKKNRDSDKVKSSKPRAKPKLVLSELSDDEEVKKPLHVPPASSISSKKNKKLRTSDIYSDESDSSGPPVLEPSVPVAPDLTKDEAKAQRRRDRDKARPKPREHAGADVSSADDAASSRARRDVKKEAPQQERRRARSGHSDERKREKSRQDIQKKDERIEAIFGPMSDSDTATSPTHAPAAAAPVEKLEKSPPASSPTVSISCQPAPHVSAPSPPVSTSPTSAAATAHSFTAAGFKGKLQVSDIYDSDSDGGAQPSVARPRTPALQPAKVRSADERKDWKDAKEQLSRPVVSMPKKETKPAINEDTSERGSSLSSVSPPRAQVAAPPKNIESSLKSMFGDYEEMSSDGPPPTPTVSCARVSVSDELRLPSSAARTPASVAPTPADDVFRFSDESSDVVGRPRKEKKKKKKKDKERKEGERRRSSVDLGKELFVDVRGSDHERASPRILSPINRPGCSPRLTSPHEMISPKTRKSPKPCLSPKPTYVSPRAAAQAAATEERRNSLDPFDQLLESRCFKSPGRHALERLPRSPAALSPARAQDGEVSLAVPAVPAAVAAVPLPAEQTPPPPPPPPAPMLSRLAEPATCDPPAAHHTTRPTVKSPAPPSPAPPAEQSPAASPAQVSEKPPPPPPAVSPVVRPDLPTELSQPSPPLRAHHSPSLPSTAVLSILPPTPEPPASTVPVTKAPTEQQPSPALSKEEKKSRAVISQEETEDAVAILLGQTFNFGYEPPSLEPEPEPEPLALAADPDEAAQAVQSLASCIGSPDKLAASPAVLETPSTPASTVEDKLDTGVEAEVASVTAHQHVAATPPHVPAGHHVAESPCRSEPELQIDEDDKQEPEPEPEPEVTVAPEPAVEPKAEPAPASASVDALEPAKTPVVAAPPEPETRVSVPSPPPPPPVEKPETAPTPPPQPQPRVEPIIVTQIKTEPKVEPNPEPKPEPLQVQPPPAVEAKPATVQMPSPIPKVVPPIIIKQDPAIAEPLPEVEKPKEPAVVQPKQEPAPEPLVPVQRPRSYSKSHTRTVSKPVQEPSVVSVPSPVIVRQPVATVPPPTTPCLATSPITPATPNPPVPAEKAAAERPAPVTAQAPVSAPAPAAVAPVSAPALTSAASVPAPTGIPPATPTPAPAEKPSPEPVNVKPPARAARVRAPRPSRSKAALAAAEAAKAAAAAENASAPPAARPAARRPARAARGKAAAAAAAAAIAEKEEAQEAASPAAPASAVSAPPPPPPPPPAEAKKPRSRAPAGGRSRKKAAQKGGDVYEFHDSGDDDATKRAEEKAAAEEKKSCAIDATIEDVVQGRFGDWEAEAAGEEKPTLPPVLGSAGTEPTKTAPPVTSASAIVPEPVVPGAVATSLSVPARLPPAAITSVAKSTVSASAATAAASTVTTASASAAAAVTTTTTTPAAPSVSPVVNEGEAMLDPVTGLMVPLKEEDTAEDPQTTAASATVVSSSPTPSLACKPEVLVSASSLASASPAVTSAGAVPKGLVLLPKPVAAVPKTSVPLPRPPITVPVRPEVYPGAGPVQRAPRPGQPPATYVHTRPQLPASAGARPQLSPASVARPQLPVSPAVRSQLPTSTIARPQLPTLASVRAQLPTPPGVRPQLPAPVAATVTSAGSTGPFAPRGPRPAAPATYISKVMPSTAGVPGKPPAPYQSHQAGAAPASAYLPTKPVVPVPAVSVFPVSKPASSQSGAATSTAADTAVYDVKPVTAAAAIFPAKTPARANSPVVLTVKPVPQQVGTTAPATTAGAAPLPAKTAASPTAPAATLQVKTVSSVTSAPTLPTSSAAAVAAAFPPKSGAGAPPATYAPAKTPVTVATSVYPAKSTPGGPVLYTAKQVVSSPSATPGGSTMNLSTAALYPVNKTAAAGAAARTPAKPAAAVSAAHTAAPATYLGKPAAAPAAVSRPSVVESPRPRPAPVGLTVEPRRLAQPPPATDQILNYKMGAAAAPAAAHQKPQQQQGPVSLTTRDAAPPEPLPEPPRVEVSGRASVGAISTPSPASQGRHSVPSPAPRPFDPALHGAVRHGVIQELHGYGDEAGRGSPHTPPPAHQRVVSQSDMLRRSGGMGIPPHLGSAPPGAELPPHYMAPFYHSYLMYHEMAMRNAAAGLPPHPGYAPPLGEGAPQPPQKPKEEAPEREPVGSSEPYPAAAARGWHQGYHEATSSSGHRAEPAAASPLQLESPACSKDIAELQRYRSVWAGQLELKSDRALVQFRLVSGSRQVADASLPRAEPMVLHIHRRMRLDYSQLDLVARKMKNDDEYCMLLAVPAIPAGGSSAEELAQLSTLRTAFITYLQVKQAAGIINIDGPQGSYVVHIFPPCDFANENMAHIAPDLLSAVSDVPHLVIVIATC